MATRQLAPAWFFDGGKHGYRSLCVYHGGMTLLIIQRNREKLTPLPPVIVTIGDLGGGLRFNVGWEKILPHGRAWGELTFTARELRTALGLDGTEAAEVEGAYIRSGTHLNIPCKGNGTGTDATVSLLLSKKIIRRITRVFPSLARA